MAAMTELAWATLSSPVGPLAVACSANGVVKVSFRTSAGHASQAGPAAEPRPADLADRGQAPPDQADPDPADSARGDSGRARLLGAARDQLAEYFAGQRRVFDLPIDWSGTSRAQHRVLSVLFAAIGYGQTITYGDLAQSAVAGPDGISLPARAIGRIMGSNPLPVIVPCHRVVAGNGLGGYSGGTGIEIKRWLLIFEGALPATLDWTPAGA
jgi:methylated-DNA-[protein]-cysteine S-methyltransferase